MFKDAKLFQLSVVGLFIIGGIVGVLVFAFGGSVGSNKNTGKQVVIWGTADERSINDTIAQVNGPVGNYINAKYIQKPAQNFNQELLEAIASGTGPDVALISVEDVFSQSNRFAVIPFKSYDQRTFQDSFVQEAELLRVYDGYLGLPFSLDPLIMFWNRDIFNNKNQPIPPAYWDTLVANVPLFSDITQDFTVKKSAISMGDFRNINHAKEILLTLILQGGSNLTELRFNSEQTNKQTLVPTFSQTKTIAGISSEESALNFYTQFADPLKNEYTWNRSLPNSLDAFVFGDLAMYIGFGSEIPLIRSKNPNLNFDIALVPQSRNSSISVTYGKLYSLSILSSSKNKGGALIAISRLSEKAFQERYALVSGLPPVRRDLLGVPPSDSYSPVLYKSAFYAKSWLDPAPSRTQDIFRNMVESVLAGRDSTNSIVKTAENQLKLIIQEFNTKNEK